MIVRVHIYLKIKLKSQLDNSRNYTHSVDLYLFDIDKMIFNITFLSIEFSFPILGYVWGMFELYKRYNWVI